jgi:hypothetical protein
MDAWNDDLARCRSWLVAFAASLAWLSVFHAAIGCGAIGVLVDVALDVAFIHLGLCICGKAIRMMNAMSHWWSFTPRRKR